jgi:hypothetical protein
MSLHAPEMRNRSHRKTNERDLARPIYNALYPRLVDLHYLSCLLYLKSSGPRPFSHDHATTALAVRPIIHRRGVCLVLLIPARRADRRVALSRSRGRRTALTPTRTRAVPEPGLTEVVCRPWCRRRSRTAELGTGTRVPQRHARCLAGYGRIWFAQHRGLARDTACSTLGGRFCGKTSWLTRCTKWGRLRGGRTKRREFDRFSKTR